VNINKIRKKGFRTYADDTILVVLELHNVNNQMFDLWGHSVKTNWHYKIRRY